MQQLSTDYDQHTFHRSHADMLDGAKAYMQTRPNTHTVQTKSLPSKSQKASNHLTVVAIFP